MVCMKLQYKLVQSLRGYGVGINTALALWTHLNQYFCAVGNANTTGADGFFIFRGFSGNSGPAFRLVLIN